MVIDLLISLIRINSHGHIYKCRCSGSMITISFEFLYIPPLIPIAHKMEIFLQNIAFAVTLEDLTIEFAKKLHNPPFPTSPLLNFEVQIFYKSHPNGKRGILALPTVDSGVTLLRAYGDTGIVVKGRKILLRESRQSINKARIERLKSVPWSDPVKLREEKERLLQQSKPFPLLRYSFGRFLRDGSFASEFTLPGIADVSCDLERRQVRFTLKGHDGDSISAASYAPLKIAALVGNQDDDTHILFIRADAPPVFSVDNNPGGNEGPRRLPGLARHYPMPPGSHSLMLAFSSQSDAETFMYACRNRLHLRYSPVPHVRIDDRISNSNPIEELHEFFSQIPYELAFQVEKTVANFVFSPIEILSLKEAILSLHTEHGPDAPEIFGSFASEHEGHSRSRKKGRKRRSQWQSSQEDLTSLLGRVVQEFIREHLRPLRLLAPPPQSGVYLSYHLIITPTRHILEGPLPDQSNSILRRYEHHECFLRVTFQDENRSKLRRDLDSSIQDLLKERYRPILLNGYRVAGRQFQFLGYSMSGLREHSVWFMTPFEDENGMQLGPESIRNNLGDFSKLYKQPARLAARWSQAFSGTDPSITLLSEEIDFHCPDRLSPSDNVMTDGCSSISVELAKDIWRSLQKGKKRPAKLRNIPSAFQFRLGGAKGMVVQDPTIEGKLVHLRPSQIKFDAPENLTFDVQSTSSRPKAMFLNRPLIVLMEFLGVDTRRIIELQDDAIAKAQSVRSSSLDASKVIQQHGLGASFHLPSLFKNLSSILQLDVGNIEEEASQSRWTSELIESSLHCAETHILRELKYRAHIGVPGSYTLLGGEVYAAVFDERTGLNKQITGQVAVTRSPQIHPGDLQVVTAVHRPELAHLRNVVVFSCEGQRALSSCLGGGDLDGDDFNLILDPKLLPTHSSGPGEYQPLPIKTTPNTCDISDIVDFVFDYIEADLVGLIAIQHLRFSDLNDPGCAECLELAKLASHAVDFPKSGTPVNFSQLPKLRKQPKPDFLAKEGADLNSDQYYNSKKLLGQLYRRVPVKEKWIPQDWNEDYSPSDGVTVEDALSRVGLRNLGLSGLSDPSEQLTEEMKYLLDAYCDQLMVIGQSHTILKNKNSHISEAELVSGTIMANWSDHHRRRDAVTAMNLQTRELVRAVRAELLAKDLVMSETETYYEDEDEDYDDWTFREEFDDTEQRSMGETFKRSWAAWCVAEDTLQEEPRMFGAQSFALIALGRMLEIVKASYIM
ncbi:RdRP-domain-containing protein [Suillus paluster]|uniref:RdRP-domain-containing protein n=1 Tax=Suillus paluster TaxID=48578 RepID=UPI001B862F65|nr:RdRP-domain-containing protein [Suillus paluster]KAG1749623.1 RdRP-domain-containing protein [Suillus paluster]